MNEAQITVTGWVAAEPFYTVTANGTPFLTVRVGCTPRRFDRRTGQWHDQDTLFLTVNCWRALADNINASELRRGHPVIVTGRLRIRQYEKDGQWRFSAEVEAATVGHDLTRGTAEFRAVQRGAVVDADRREARAVTDQWALASARAADGPDGRSADQPEQPVQAPRAPEAGPDPRVPLTAAEPPAADGPAGAEQDRAA
ncbi:single-stranded DNA-binding protein [Spirillospora sp. NPDC127200]